jgi:hypothetical protein
MIWYNILLIGVNDIIKCGNYKHIGIGTYNLR